LVEYRAVLCNVAGVTVKPRADRTAIASASGRDDQQDDTGNLDDGQDDDP
jgi:hypothetical protein